MVFGQAKREIVCVPSRSSEGPAFLFSLRVFFGRLWVYNCYPKLFLTHGYAFVIYQFISTVAARKVLECCGPDPASCRLSLLFLFCIIQVSFFYSYYYKSTAVTRIDLYDFMFGPVQSTFIKVIFFQVVLLFC